MLNAIEVMCYELMKKGVFHAEVENAVGNAVIRYQVRQNLIEILEESGESFSDSEMENIIDDALKLKEQYNTYEEALKKAVDKHSYWGHISWEEAIEEARKRIKEEQNS